METKVNTKKASRVEVYEGKIVDVRAVAREIIKLKFKRTHTLKQCVDEFYKIMRKYSIKQGTANFNSKGEEVSRSCNNYEWTICKELFLKQITLFIDWQDLFGSYIPKDLLK